MIGVVIQARLGSTRFPRKVLADLNGKSVLQHVWERASEIGPKVILATPDAELAMRYTPHFLGSENDVLGRYSKCAERYELDIIVRITADCPLLRPDLCQKVIELQRKAGVAYAAIAEGMTFPKGYGCEVFTRTALDLADTFATDPYDREHVTPWIEDHCHKAYLTQEQDESHLNYCIDTPGDLERLRAMKA